MLNKLNLNLLKLSLQGLWKYNVIVGIYEFELIFIQIWLWIIIVVIEVVI